MEDRKIEQRDYYAILGLSRDASFEEIKKQYRNLSRQFHPDKQSVEHQDFANEFFQRIDRAYQILGDEKKRRLYDLLSICWRTTSSSSNVMTYATLSAPFH
ncbi:uncharacterized protein [Blastocystis hominis]|uniref:J domain-containing protein n=1 Tax=Blastocystis hominis TaxID=12968 RepID=D8MBI5_BLAHO|nr:uncharacterized protein [Blastocystis hominis]CBK25424.2 unnamed protein product [Blastocystis hominis]|eukprot:XP_012899472.1 uncharacterized protein [Blastocystis hominis]